MCGECLDIECDRVSPQPSAVPTISHIPDITPYRSNEPTVVPSFFPVDYVCGCSLCSLSLNELTKNNISCYDRYRHLKIKFPGKKEKKICEKIYDKYDNCFPSCDPKICLEISNLSTDDTLATSTISLSNLICECNGCSLSLNYTTNNNLSCFDEYKLLKFKFPERKEKKICEKLAQKYNDCFQSCDPSSCY